VSYSSPQPVYYLLVRPGHRVGTQPSAPATRAGSDIGLALTQTDALSQFLHSNEKFANEFIVLGDAGKECVVLITGKNSGISSFADLKKQGGEISIDDPGSGASATFAYLQDMDPNFARTKPAYVDTIEALLQIKVAGKYTDLKAAMLVQRPTTRSAPVTVLLENPKDYRLIPVSEADIENSKLPDGSVVYTFEQVNIGETSGQYDLHPRPAPRFEAKARA